MTRKFIPLLILLTLACGISAAYALGIGGLGTRFGKAGAIGKATAFIPPPSCGSPNAPDGVIDLSKCSNAFYAAVIF